MITPQPGWKIDPNNPNGVVKDDAYQAPSPAPAGGTPPNPPKSAPYVGPTPNGAPVPPPTSPINSSAMIPLSQGATTATQSAQHSLSQPPPPTPDQTTSITTSTGQKISPNGAYQYQLANGSIVSIGDPSISKSMLGGATYLMGPKGNESNPLSSGDSISTLPGGFAAGAVDNNGNTTYSLPSGQTVTIGSGVSHPAKFLTGFNNLSLAVGSLGQGYSLAADTSGNVSVKDPSGQAWSFGPSTVSSADSYSEALGAIGSVKATVDAANADTSAQIQGLDATHDATLQSLKDEMTTAQESERSAYGMSVGSTDNTSGSTSRFQKLIDEENQSYSAQKAAIKSGNMKIIAAAYSDAQKSLQSIEENAKQSVISTSQYAEQTTIQKQQYAEQTTIQKQQNAISNFSTMLTKFGSIDPSTPEGSAAVGQLVSTGLQGGLTMEGAMGYVNLGTLAAKKLDQQTFVQNVKSEMVPSSISGMTVDQATKDTGAVGYLMKLGQSTGQTSSETLGFLQNLYQNKKQTLDLAKEQADISRASVGAQVALANLQIREMTASQRQASTINKTLSSKSTPTGTLVNALAFKSIADESVKAIQLGNSPNATEAQKADARAASSKLLAVDSRAFTGGVARMGNVQLEESAQSLSDKISNAGNFVVGGSHIISTEYAQGLGTAMDTFVSGLASDPGVVSEYNSLKANRDALIQRTPEYQSDIEANSSLLGVIQPVMEVSSSKDSSSSSSAGGVQITPGGFQYTIN